MNFSRLLVRVVSLSILSILMLVSTPLVGQYDRYKAMFDSASAMIPHQLGTADSIATWLLVESNRITDDQDKFFGRASFFKGIVQLYLGNLIVAEKHFNDALNTTYISETNLRLKESCYNNLGVVYDKEGKLNSALEAFTASLKIAEEWQDSFTIMQTWINISLIENKMKNRERAIEIGNKVLAFFEKMDNAEHAGLAWYNLGQFESDRSNFNLAINYYEKALGLFEKNEDYFNLGWTLGNLSDTYDKIGDYAQTRFYLDKVFSIAQTHDLNGLLVFLNLVAGKTEKNNTKNYSLAVQYLKKGEQLALETRQLEYLGDIYLAQADLFAKSGDYDAYTQAMDAYLKHEEASTKEASASYHEQMRALYKHDQLMNQQAKLENAIVQKNKQLTFAVVVILLVMVAGGSIYYLYTKNIDYGKALFRINVHARKLSKDIVGSQTDRLTQPALNLDQIDEEVEDLSFDRYRTFMDVLSSKKLYLDPEITIQSLAIALNTNQKYLSQSISAWSGTNFYGILKELRIEEACRLMIDKPDNLSIKEVYQQAGYNNRYTFYKQFKEITGLSPTAFSELATKQQKDDFFIGKSDNATFSA